tara:strand:+ start:8018 stop:8581 length:564 start_codon:yes stop_codon:yes gene_type:complete
MKGSKMKKSYALLFFGVVFTAVNAMLLQQWKINRLNASLELSEMRANINTEWTNELLAQKLNDVHTLSEEALVAQGRLEGVVAHLSGDNKEVQENLWHEGYMRGLSQTDWEYDVISEANFQKGYREALEVAFPNGDYPQYVNYPPREVNKDAILTPEFDKKADTIESNQQVLDQLNDKIKQVKNGGQ